MEIAFRQPLLPELPDVLTITLLLQSYLVKKTLIRTAVGIGNISFRT